MHAPFRRQRVALFFRAPQARFNIHSLWIIAHARETPLSCAAAAQAPNGMELRKNSGGAIFLPFVRNGAPTPPSDRGCGHKFGTAHDTRKDLVGRPRAHSSAQTPPKRRARRFIKKVRGAICFAFREQWRASALPSDRGYGRAFGEVQELW